MSKYLLLYYLFALCFIATFKSGYTQAGLKEYLRLDPESFYQAASEKLNYNPVITYGPELQSDLELHSTGDWSDATVFTVFQSNSPIQEQTVWHLSTSQKDQLLTNRHLVDLGGSKLFPYKLREPHLPHYNHYYFSGEQQFDNKDSIVFHVGRYIGGYDNLPVAPLTGFVGETRIYDRILSRQERRRVSTYYAIKYGLSLAGQDSMVYVSGSGRRIWDGKKNSPFFHRIAGVGRDSITGLNQKQSTSSYAPDLFTFSLGKLAADNESNKSNIPDGSYMLWGDDNGGLVFGENSGIGKLTERRWLFEMSGVSIECPGYLRLNSRRWLDRVTDEDKIWLVIDSSGVGDFLAPNSLFVAATRQEDSGFIYFDSIPIPSTTRQVWTFSKGAELLPLYWIEESLCDSGTGALQVGAVGGVPPYNYELSNMKGERIAKWESNRGYASIDNLKESKYLLRITDEDGRVVVQWIDGCQPNNQAKKRERNKAVADYFLAPNPTFDGHFTLELRLWEKGGIDFSITSSDGKLYRRDRFSDDSYYQIRGMLPVSGIYHLNVRTQQGRVSIPIVRQ